MSDDVFLNVWWFAQNEQTSCLMIRKPFCEHWNFVVHGPWRHHVASLNLINSLAPGKFEWNFGYVIFKRILVIDGWGICCEIALIWMSLDFTDDQSTLVQVMAWCRQATSHYLKHCWPRSMSPYGVTRPQWVNTGSDNGFILECCQMA